MDVKLNHDVLEGKWKQVRGLVKQHWGRLTDSQLDRIQGRSEELAGLLQEHYGYTRAQAQQAIQGFLERVEHMKKTARR